MPFLLIAFPVFDPIAIDHDCEVVFVHIRSERYAIGCGLRLESLKRFVDESRGAKWFEVEPDSPLLDPGEIEEVVDHGEDSIGVLARCQEELDLFGREGADQLLEQQVNRHLHTGERGFELV